MVAIDASVLMLLLRPDAGRPLDAAGRPVAHAPERVAWLIQQLAEQRVTIIIPTPALSEVLVRSDASQTNDLIAEIRRHRVFRVESFDERAAVEAALMTRSAISSGSKRRGSAATWAKVKFDQQIVAIARVAGASAIYSDDIDLRTMGRRAGMAVKGIADLELPPESAQLDLLAQPREGGEHDPTSD